MTQREYISMLIHMDALHQRFESNETSPLEDIRIMLHLKWLYVKVWLHETFSCSLQNKP